MTLPSDMTAEARQIPRWRMDPCKAAAPAAPCTSVLIMAIAHQRNLGVRAVGGNGDNLLFIIVGESAA